MEDASPKVTIPLPGSDIGPERVAVTSPPAAAFNHELLEDNQIALQRIAQDASSQAGNLVADAPRHQQETVESNPVSTHAFMRAHELPLSNGILDEVAYATGYLNQPNPQLDAGQAQALDPSCNRHDQSNLPIGPLSLTQDNVHALADDPNLENATASLADIESEAPRISAFAKLEFDDGVFFMNTYSLELGRDVRAARQMSERDIQSVRRRSGSSRKRSSSDGDQSRSSSNKVKRGNRRHQPSSIVSESGGVMAVDHSDSELPQQRRRKKSKSATSSSQQLSRKSSMNFPGMRTDYQSLALESLSDSLPSPDACPLVPIHPPISIDGILTSHKSISRKHVKIAFNFEKNLFELMVLGRNGAFVDEQWHAAGETQPLRSGSLIQIGGVGIRFLLPEVALGETGAERNMNSDPASFEFENGEGASGDMGDSSDADREKQGEQDESRDNSHEDESEESGEDGESEAISEEERRGRTREPKPTLANRPVRNRNPVAGKQTTKTKPTKKKEPPKAKRPQEVKPKLKTRKESTPEPAADPPAKRKGPGRPPKNGIISKRAQAELAKQAREAAKAAAQGETNAKPGRGKGKSIPLQAEVRMEESNLQPNGKRKYKKRKPKADAEGGEPQIVRESTEHTESMPPEQNVAPTPPQKPPKPVKPPKPPRSPSPVFDEATLTPEQLAKPQASYVILIHEALSNSKTGQMSLPQIYRAIERKYPFYKLRVQTTGWQSSVRHNLSQHPAFRKIERDGKGWMWGLVPEISIEKEKKRRMTPPPMPAPGYYPAPQMMQPPYPYPMPYPPYAPYPGMPMGPRPPYPPPQHFAPQTTASSLPPALANAVDASSTYQSPYAAGPSPQTAETLQHVPMTNGPQPTPTPAPARPQDTQTANQPPHPANSDVQNPSPNPNPISTQLPYGPAQPSIPSLQKLLSQQTPEVATIVQKFKSHLLSSMSDDPSAEPLIDSAISRVLNPHCPAPVPTPSPYPSGEGEDDRQEKHDRHEKAIGSILQGMLDNLRKKHGENGTVPFAPSASSADAANINGTGAAATAAAATGNENPATTPSGARDPTLFLEILEKVREESDGTLPLPLPLAHRTPTTRGGDSPVPSGGGGGAFENAGSKSVNGIIPRPITTTTTTTTTISPKPANEAVVVAGSSRGLKRILDDDREEEEEEEEGEGAMDQGPRAAKRVAI
ncbi:MAG: hypothetical protein Q9182_005340 [Xanthomendoza sp. 2 TL-2023]